MSNVILAEPGTIAPFGLGLLILTFLAVAAVVCIFAIRAKRQGRTLFDFAFGKMVERQNPVSSVAPVTQIIPRKCPQCGAELKPDVPEGLCPACLLQRGIATEGGGGATATFTPPPVAELAELFPQLHILESIGQGGMGAVYKARQPALDRLVALKILVPQSSGDLDFAERFTREARALAKLNHPNIVAVYDFGVVARATRPFDSKQQHTGKTPVPLHYFIMEYVDGLNLRQIEQAGKLKPQEALQIIPQICAALQFAHDEGIVHRDIKPENILLDKKGRVKIADFGLAKITGLEAKDFRLTGARDVMGTPHYMAPEQIEKPLTVDHRADIYSLGVVFYEMLTGELPLGKFQSPSKKVQIDVRLDEVVLHALEKEPERRYQQASEIKTRVETIAHTPSVVVGEKILRSPFTILNATPFSKFIFGAAIPIFGCYFFLLLNDHFNGTNQKLWHYYSYVFFTFAAICGVDTVLRLRRGLRARTAKSSQELKFMYLTMLFSGMLAVAIIFVFVFLPGWQRHHAPPSDTTFYIGQAWFPQGDSIEITSVERTQNRLTVKGHYHLVSHDQALLALYFTTVNKISVPVGPDERIQISKGRGDFELIDPHLVPGLPHVSMYGADGHPFASLYFGTKAEALEESQAKWISETNQVNEDAAQLAKEGWQLWQAQRFDEAAAKFNQAVKLAPDNASAWNGLGWAEFNSGKTDGAGTAFQKAVSIEPDQPGALNGLGQIYLAQRKYDQAEAYLLKAAPQAPAAWYGLTRLYLLEGKFDQAQKWAQNLIDAGQADDLAQQMLKAAQAKQLSEGLRFRIEPPATANEKTGTPAGSAVTNPLATMQTSEPNDLREARARLVELRVNYGEQSPEIQRVLARIKELEHLTKEEPNDSPELREAKAHLAELRVDYAEQNPRIQEALARVKALEQDNGATTETNASPGSRSPAPEPQAVSEAQKWLALIDAGNYSESWKEASAIFRGGVTETGWENSMNTFRKPLGDLRSRKLKSAQPLTELPGAPDGQYVVTQFATSFANKNSAMETVTFMVEKDGHWRAAGYYIK